MRRRQLLHWTPILILSVTCGGSWKSMIATANDVDTTTSAAMVESSTSRTLLSLGVGGTTCNLPCENGGVCRIKATFPFTSINPSLSSSSNNYNMSAGEYCDCSNTNYLGEFCDIQVQVCSSSSVVCLYGSVCVEDSVGFHCECSPNATTAQTGDISNSLSCHHHQTKICTTPGVQPGRATTFCVNNGVCDGQG